MPKPNNPPVITGPLDVSVAENQTFVLDIDANDKGDSFTFAISGGVDADAFTIDPSTGVLSFNSPPDFESLDEGKIFFVEVTVTDSTGLSDTEIISVTVTDVDEGGGLAPTIDSSATATVDENQIAAIDVNASDPESDTLTYSISGGADADKFNINANTGEVTFKTAPNYEAFADFNGDNDYEVQVTVSDGTSTDTQDITITVADVDESGNTAPTIDSGATATVNENQTFAIDVEASDAEFDTLIYTISGGVDAALFNIDSNTGEITFKSAPDFEAAADADGDNDYEFQITVSDGDLSAAQDVTISVADVNEDLGGTLAAYGLAASSDSGASNSDNVTNQTQGLVIEGGHDGSTNKVQVWINGSFAGNATLNSNGTWTYVTDLSDGDHTIEAAIIVGKGKNRETVFSTDSAAITVDTTSPTITSGAAALIEEGETVAIDVDATDAQSAVSYAISGGVDAGVFSIDATTGVISFVEAPDYEAPQDDNNDNVYDIQVSATDLAGNNATQNISITVTDIPDGGNNPPSITGDVLGSVTEDDPTTAAGALAVSDVDAGESGTQADAGSTTYGDFTVNATGDWEYTLDSANGAVQALGAGASLTDSFVVTSTDGSASETVTVTINGANDGASITGDVLGSVTEDDPTTAAGALAVSDVDAGESGTQADAGSTTYGDFTVNATGDWEYTLDSANGAVQALGAGASLTDSFVVTSTDGSASETVTVTINGANDGASITGDVLGSVTEDDPTTAAGALAVSDVDAGESGTQADAGSTTYGDFTVNATGDWEYTLDSANGAVQALGAGASLTDSFVVTSTDGSASETVTVTINGANDGASITGDVLGSVTEDDPTTAAGALAVSDVDAGESGTQADAGSTTYGDFTVNATGDWEYTLDSANGAVQALGAGASLTDSFVVTSTDGSASETVTVTINGANDGASITGDVLGSVTEDDPTTAAGALAVSDVDAGESGTQADAGSTTYGDFTVNATGDWEYTLDSANGAVQALGAGASLTDSFVVTSTDGSASETVTVTINGANDGASITGDVLGSVTEDDPTTAAGALAVSDVDAGESGTQADAGSTTYGDFTVNATGDWEYTLDSANGAVQALGAGASLTDSFVVTSTDGSASETVTVTINGANDGASITGDVLGSVTEDDPTTAAGALAVSDVDAGESGTQADAGSTTYGDFTVNATGDWEYTLDSANGAVQALGAGASLTDSFVVTSTDGSASETVTVTINGQDEADTTTPTASAPDLLPGSDSGSSNSDDLTSIETAAFRFFLDPSVAVDDEIALLISGVENVSHVITSVDFIAGYVDLTSTSLAEGANTISARLSDPSGNNSETAALVVTYDSSEPDAPSSLDLATGSDSGASDTDDVTNDATPTITGAAEAGSTVRLYDGLVEVGSAVAGGDGAWSITTSALSEGARTLTATAEDAAGNVSSASAALVVTIDTSTSTPTIDQVLEDGGPVSGGYTTDATPEFHGMAEAGSTVTLRNGASVLGAVVADGTGAWSLVIASPLADGVYNITAEAVDAAGNSETSSVVQLEIDAVADPVDPGPQDEPLFGEQWHLQELGDLDAVWEDYSGAGVTVAIYDDGVEWSHVDLDDNYDETLHLVFGTTELDPMPILETEGRHGTAVAGVIAAEANGSGTVGVAFDATLVGVNIFTGPANINDSATLAGFEYAIDQQYLFDVVNHSWGGLPIYLNDTNAATIAARDAFAYAAEFGRDGLGTNVVKAAGNWSDSSQGDYSDVTRHTITVAAYDSDGDASWYSNRGANILLSAPSSGLTKADPDGNLLPDSDLRIATTDRDGTFGYADDAWSSSQDTSGFGGTSSSTPTVAGVIALMLEANPDLGWRDVQNILAYSARHTGDGEFGVQNTATEVVPVDLDFDAVFETTAARPIEFSSWRYNGADNWNGGGLHFSEDYGFGALDAYNAIRMAEVWSLFDVAQTTANEISLSGGRYETERDIFDTLFGRPQHPDAIIDPALENSWFGRPGDPTSFSYSMTVADMDMSIEYVDLYLHFNTVSLADLEITLTSPEGTEITLMALPLNDYAPEFTGFVYIDWTFGAHAFKGEDPNGVWTVELTEVVFGNYVGGVLADGNNIIGVELIFHGSATSTDDIHHYTDEVFDTLLNDASRQTLEDTNGGEDWLNLAAMTGDLNVDLNAGATSLADGVGFLTIASGTDIENVVTGDGADVIIGSALDNKLNGMRGDDILDGAGGSNILTGGAGADKFYFDEGFGVTTVTDFEFDIDQVDVSDFDEILDFADFLGGSVEAGSDVIFDVGTADENKIVFENATIAQFDADDFAFA